MISAVFLSIKSVAGEDGVGEATAGFFDELLARGQFTVVLFPGVGAHDQRGSGVVVAECDNGSEAAFAAQILAVDGETFWQQVAMGDEPLVDGLGE